MDNTVGSLNDPVTTKAQSRNRLDSSNYYTPASPKREPRNIPEYITGYVDGFEKFPFLSTKQKDFDLFRHICCLIHEKKHLSKDGFIEIVHLAYAMNGSGKRRRTKEEIINSLIEKKI